MGTKPVQIRKIVRLGSALYGAVMCGSFTPSYVEAQHADERDIAIEDPRPVAKALEILLAEHGDVIVTYEDPPYAYVGDIEDVTAEVRRDLDRFDDGAAPKVLVPRGGILRATYAIAADSGDPADWGTAVQTVIDAQLSAANGGRFRVERGATAFHVVPTQVRDTNGNWVAVQSVLDSTVSISTEGDGVELLDAIVGAVSKGTGQRILVGRIPLNLLKRYHGVLNTSGTPARDVLMQFLSSTGAKLRWELFYGPDIKAYALNLGVVAIPQAPPPADSPPDHSLPRPGDPPPVFLRQSPD